LTANLNNFYATKHQRQIESVAEDKMRQMRFGKMYTNPMAKCFGCGGKFCFDHITGGVEIKGQNPNEELKDVCDFCLPKLKA